MRSESTPAAKAKTRLRRRPAGRAPLDDDHLRAPPPPWTAPRCHPQTFPPRGPSKLPRKTPVALTTISPPGRWFLFRPVAVYLLCRAVTLASLAIADLFTHKGLSGDLDIWDATLVHSGRPARVARPPAHGQRPRVAQHARLPARFPLDHPVAVRHHRTFAGGRRSGDQWGDRPERDRARWGCWCATSPTPVKAERAALLLAVFPGTFVFSLAYGEGIVITCVALGLLALLRRQWWLAGVLGLVATATSPIALAFVVSCAWCAGSEIRRNRNWRSLSAPILAPLGFVGYMVWLWVHTGNLWAWRVAERGGWKSYPSLAYPIHVVTTFVVDPVAPTRTGQLLMIGTVAAVIGAVLAIRERQPAPVLLYGLVAAGMAAIVCSGRTPPSVSHAGIPPDRRGGHPISGQGLWVDGGLFGLPPGGHDPLDPGIHCGVPVTISDQAPVAVRPTALERMAAPWRGPHRPSSEPIGGPRAVRMEPGLAGGGPRRPRLLGSVVRMAGAALVAPLLVLGGGVGMADGLAGRRPQLAGDPAGGSVRLAGGSGGAPSGGHPCPSVLHHRFGGLQPGGQPGACPGKDPYTASMAPAAKLLHIPSNYWTYTVDGGHVTHVSYPAGSFLLQAPVMALGFHHQVTDWIDLVAWLVTGVLLFAMLPASLRWLSALILLTPLFVGTFANGGTDALFFPFLIVAVWQWDRFGTGKGSGMAAWIGPLCLGLACSIKQTPWFCVPLLVIGVGLEAKRRGRNPWPVAAGYLAIVAGRVHRWSISRSSSGSRAHG